MKIKKNNLITLLFIICFSVISIICKENISLQMVLIILIALKLLSDSFKYKRLLFFLFCSLVLELDVVIYLFIHVFKLPETSWRRIFAISSISDISLFYINMSFLLFSLVYYLFDVNGEKEVINTLKYYSISNTFFSVYAAMSLAFLIIFVRWGGFFAWRDYANQGNGKMMSAYRIIEVLYVFIYIWKKTYEKVSILQRVMFWAFIICDFVMGVMGYRYILVEIAFLIFVLFIQRAKEANIKQLLKYVLLFVLFYLLLIILKNNISKATNTLDLYFRHERCIFYSMNSVVTDTSTHSVNTYINTLLGLLPIKTSYRIEKNTGNILLSCMNGKVSFAEGMTMGGFYLSEAFFNYKEKGILLISIIIPIVFVFLEKKRTTSKSWFFPVLYAFVAAQEYNMVYYGSSNYIKIIVFLLVFLAIQFFIERFIFIQKG